MQEVEGEKLAEESERADYAANVIRDDDVKSSF